MQSSKGNGRKDLEMAASIVVTSKKEAERLGVPVGTIIKAENGPEHLVERQASIMSSTVSESVVENSEKSAEWAKQVRERVAEGRLPF